MRRIFAGPNPVQLLIAGKAHPNDEEGKGTLQQIFQLRRDGASELERVVVIEDYDLRIAKWLVSGCDVWVNLPRRPLEASGTSGMKATFNGALQLSVLDGWWAEAYDGANGWAIPGDEGDDETDATRFYDLLEHEVIPLFYDRDAAGVPNGWCEMVKRALVTCGPTFTRDAHGARLRRAHVSGAEELRSASRLTGVVTPKGSTTFATIPILSGAG